MGRILTIHDSPLMSEKTVDNFEGLGGGRPTLVRSEPIQPLNRRFDVLLFPKFPRKFL